MLSDAVRMKLSEKLHGFTADKCVAQLRAAWNRRAKAAALPPKNAPEPGRTRYHEYPTLSLEDAMRFMDRFLVPALERIKTALEEELTQVNADLQRLNIEADIEAGAELDADELAAGEA